MRQRAFDTWREARNAAQQWANELGLSVGLEGPDTDLPKSMQKWTIKLVPGKKYRCGWELRCEIVDPDYVR